MKPVGTQTLETERLLLRKIERGDALAVFRNWASDPLVTRYLSWDVHASPQVSAGYVEWKAKRYLEEEYVFDWVIVLKESDEPIGEIEAVRVSPANGLAEIGYCLGANYWNKGLMTEALKACIAYLFGKAEVDKIVACHISSNPASGKVMAKSGMHLDGSLKGYLVDKNTKKRCDQVWYSIDKAAK